MRYVAVVRDTIRALVRRIRWVVPALPVAATVVWVMSLEPRSSSAKASVGRPSVLRPLSEVVPTLVSAVAEGDDTSWPERAEPHSNELSQASVVGQDSTLVEADVELDDPCLVDLDRVLRADHVASETFSAPGRGQVALTFDDGPSRTVTPKILRILKRKRVTASFFMLGERAIASPDLVDEVGLAGHDIGSHGWTHSSLRSLWKSQIRDEVCQTQAAIESASGIRPRYFRPPYGRYAPSALPLLGGLGYDVVLWSVDSEDWTPERDDDPQAIARSVLHQARDGSIILLHDIESATVEALPMIIDGLRERGFELVPVSTLLQSE